MDKKQYDALKNMFKQTEENIGNIKEEMEKVVKILDMTARKVGSLAGSVNESHGYNKAIWEKCVDVDRFKGRLYNEINRKTGWEKSEIKRAVERVIRGMME